MKRTVSRIHGRRSSAISRRGFIAGAGAIALGAGAAKIVGCSNGDPGREQAVLPASAHTPVPMPATHRGGVLRAFNFDAQGYDALDPHLTQFGPIANVHSAIFSRVLRYADERSLSIEPDLAAALPEQPDETTYIVRLRADARFHDTPRTRAAFPQVAGRDLTADDVKFSIERQLNRRSPQSVRFFRRDQWDAIESIDVVDTHTLKITTKTPTAPFAAFLAGRHAFVVPREVIDLEDRIAHDNGLIGSGPFALESLEPGVVVRLRRNGAWHGRDDAGGSTGRDRPFLEGYDAFLSPQEDEFQRIGFARKGVDATSFTDPATYERERTTNLAGINIQETDAGAVLACRLLLDRSPFLDDRIRRALHLALNRRAIAALVYPDMDGRDSARLSGPVAPGSSRWALDQHDLEMRPGYRADASGRDEDLKDARALWSAAAGDGGISELRMLVAGMPRIVSERAAPAIVQQLKDALGVMVTPTVDATGHALISQAYVRNIEAATEGAATMTLQVEDGGVDLDDWLYTHFRSGGANNTYRVQDAQLDALLDGSRAEFDVEARRQIGLDVQDYLLANVNARIVICAPVERRLVWGYVRNAELPLWYGSNQDLADVWLDASHAAWAGRPA